MNAANVTKVVSKYMCMESGSAKVKTIQKNVIDSYGSGWVGPYITREKTNWKSQYYLSDGFPNRKLWIGCVSFFPIFLEFC